MSRSGNDKEDDLLEDFFASLEIADNEETDVASRGIYAAANRNTADTAAAAEPRFQHEVESDDQLTANNACKSTKQSSKRNSQKQQLIQRAEQSQTSWAEFQIDTTKSDKTKVGDARPGISFSLKAPGKGKGKKKKAKQPPAKTEIENFPTASSKTADSILPQRPLWIAAIDTCCLLEDGGTAIKDILRLAKTAQCLEDADPKRALYAASLDGIQLLIPHVVWGELDGISKRSQNRRNGGDEAANREEVEELSRRARAATKMLRGEMEIQAAHTREDELLQKKCRLSIIKAQTMEEMKASSDKYLPAGDTLVNDDHILACTLSQRTKTSEHGVGTPTAGGAVLLTSDTNLSCKALSNGVRVFSPEEFYKHLSLRSEVRKSIFKEQRSPLP